MKEFFFTVILLVSFNSVTVGQDPWTAAWIANEFAGGAIGHVGAMTLKSILGSESNGSESKLRAVFDEYLQKMRVEFQQTLNRERLERAQSRLEAVRVLYLEYLNNRGDIARLNSVITESEFLIQDLKSIGPIAIDNYVFIASLRLNILMTNHERTKGEYENIIKAIDAYRKDIRELARQLGDIKASQKYDGGSYVFTSHNNLIGVYYILKGQYLGPRWDQQQMEWVINDKKNETSDRTSEKILAQYSSVIMHDWVGIELKADEMKGQTICSGPFNGDKRVGIWMCRYPFNDQLALSGNYKNNLKDGIWVAYYSNGNMKSKEFFENGRQEGGAEYYGYLEGKLMAKGNYKEGLKIGTWVNYAYSGSVYQEEVYETGVKVEERNYNSKNGCLSLIMKFSNNRIRKKIDLNCKGNVRMEVVYTGETYYDDYLRNQFAKSNKCKYPNYSDCPLEASYKWKDGLNVRTVNYYKNQSIKSISEYLGQNNYEKKCYGKGKPRSLGDLINCSELDDN